MVEENVKKRKLSGDNPDAVALLTAAAEFRTREERAPLKGDMASLLSSSPNLSHLTPMMAYNKLRHIRHRFLASALADAHLLALASRAWDPKAHTGTRGGHHEEEDDDGEDVEEEPPSLELLKMEAEEYWKRNGMSLVQLKMGMEWMDRSKAKALESKWRRHNIAGMVIKRNKLSLFKELYYALYRTTSSSKDD